MIFPGNAKDAKAVQVKAREKAKVVQACTEGNTNKNANVNEARKEANSEIREADTRQPKSAVTALAGDAKDTCQADAKTKFGM